MFRYYNPNPLSKQVGDCTVRAITKLLNLSWDEVYDALCKEGHKLADMPSANSVWGSYLRSKGFEVLPLANTCPMCYTVTDFCREHPVGTYLLATGEHVVAVSGGDYFDCWDSGNEIPMYVWRHM